MNIDKVHFLDNNIYMNLMVNEIFHSIQGESTRAGFRSIFIRLTGCNLNCSFCDTDYAKNAGSILSINDIIDEIQKIGKCDHITLTGGEPLLQTKSLALMKELINMDYSINLETNGSINVKDVPDKTRKIVDVKTPSSGESDSFLMDNLKYIDEHDELKFVISDLRDYKFAKEFIDRNLANTKATINLSPVYETMSYAELAEQIIVDRLPVRLNLQQHKIIWPKGEPETRLN